MTVKLRPLDFKHVRIALLFTQKPMEDATLAQNTLQFPTHVTLVTAMSMDCLYNQTPVVFFAITLLSTIVFNAIVLIQPNVYHVILDITLKTINSVHNAWLKDV